MQPSNWLTGTFARNIPAGRGPLVSLRHPSQGPSAPSTSPAGDTGFLSSLRRPPLSGLSPPSMPPAYKTRALSSLYSLHVHLGWW